MGFRFRKTVRFGRLVRLNFSGSGVSVGLGPPGANVNIGPKGVRRTIGIPGTGLSHQSFSSWQSQPSTNNRPPPQTALPNDPAATPTPSAPRTGRTVLWIGIIAFTLLGLIVLMRPNLTGAPASSVAVSQLAHQTSTPVSQLPVRQSAISQSAISQPPISQPPVNDLQVEDPKPLSVDDVREVQNRLKALGFDPGAIDGLDGPQTSSAAKRYRAARKLQDTGVLDRKLLAQLRQEAPTLDTQPTMSLRVESPTRPSIYGATNLPDGAKLIVTVARRESKYMAQDDVTVRNGQFKTAAFSSQGQSLNPGTYSVRVTMSLAELQDVSVRAIIGAKGERMSGPLVKRGTLGPTIEYASSFVVPGISNAQLDAKARQKTEEDLKQWIVKSCEDNVDLVNRMVRAGLVAGHEILGPEREERVANCIREVAR